MKIFVSRFARRLLLVACLLTAPLVHADLATQRQQFERAYRLAKQGQPWTEEASGLRGYPLLAWVEHATLMNTPRPETARVEAFVARHGDTYLAADLRKLLAHRYAESERWAELVALDIPLPDQETRCRQIRAQIEVDVAAGVDPLHNAEPARTLWLSAQSQPPACTPVFDWLRAKKQIDSERVWQRVALVAMQGQPQFLRQLATSMDAKDRVAVQHLADLLLDPARQRRNAKQWPADNAHRRALSYAVARIARRDDDLAVALWREFGTHMEFDDDSKARMLDAIALYRANAYKSDAANWLELIPLGKDSAMTREWRVREALSRGDFAAAAVGISRMDETQRADPRWRYWHARALDETGQTQLAALAWRALASASNFHGFLAADRIGAAYQMCPIDTPRVELADAIKRYPALERALEFRAIGWKPQANREWAHLMARLDSEGRREVVTVADQQAWFDRAPFALNAVEDQRMYTLRFALAHRDLIEAAAKAQKIDAALVYGLIRSESAWVEDARSGADAYGLMQLLPSTAHRVAKLEGVSFAGTAPLLDAPLNVRLGTRYLAEVGKRYQDSPWLVAAAYNAGPGRVEQWLTQRGRLPADVFIETIPFKETREYVSRVLAFTQIYDWRLHGDMRPLSERLPGQGQQYDASAATRSRRKVECAM